MTPLMGHQVEAVELMTLEAARSRVLALRAPSGIGRSTAMSRFAARLGPQAGLLVSPPTLQAQWRRQLEDAGLTTRTFATRGAFTGADPFTGVTIVSYRMILDVPHVLAHVAGFDWTIASIGSPMPVLSRLRKVARRLFIETDGLRETPTGPGPDTAFVDMRLPRDQV